MGGANKPHGASKPPASDLPVGKRESNKRDKLRRVRAAASELFERRGFANTTTQAVAALAGIGSGTLFLYARTKVELLEIVMSADIQEIINRRAVVIPAKSKLPEASWSIFRQLLKYHHAREELSQHFVRETTLSNRRGEVRNMSNPTSQTLLQALENLVRREQRSGRVRADLHPHDIALNLFAFFHLAMMMMLNGSASFSGASRFLRKSLAALYDGVSSVDHNPVPRVSALRSK